MAVPESVQDSFMIAINKILTYSPKFYIMDYIKEGYLWPFQKASKILSRSP
jgi:hypothetical protein